MISAILKAIASNLDNGLTAVLHETGSLLGKETMTERTVRMIKQYVSQKKHVGGCLKRREDH